MEDADAQHVLKKVILNRSNLGPNSILICLPCPHKKVWYPRGGNGYDYFLLFFPESSFITKNSLYLDTSVYAF